MGDPTEERGRHDRGEMRCKGCGRPEDQWEDPMGFSMGGDVYCCEGCAMGTGCICDPDRHEREP
ncbi:MAG: hypothetical protein GX591_02820 [Planctomycetes bacterium]|nr:hypothetical protein [Planctomycetota bacterium]